MTGPRMKFAASFGTGTAHHTGIIHTVLLAFPRAPNTKTKKVQKSS